MDRTTDIDQIKKGHGFSWGQAAGMFKEIDHYTILPYHPWVVNGVSVEVGNADMNKTEYYLWIDGKDASESFDTLDEALAAGIAYRAEGCNHRADKYFIKSIS